MKIVANHDICGMSLDSESGASYNRHYIVRVYVKRRLAIQER